MARVITPSGDEVRTVYSSGGFAAGDLVFLKSTGYEKIPASYNVSFPISATANNFYGASQPQGLAALNFASCALGPNQIGGGYTGPAISRGAQQLSNQVVNSSVGYAAMAQLADGNFAVLYYTTTGTYTANNAYFKVIDYAGNTIAGPTSLGSTVVANFSSASITPHPTQSAFVLNYPYSYGTQAIRFVSGSNYSTLSSILGTQNQTIAPGKNAVSLSTDGQVNFFDQTGAIYTVSTSYSTTPFPGTGGFTSYSISFDPSAYGSYSSPTYSPGFLATAVPSGLPYAGYGISTGVYYFNGTSTWGLMFMVQYANNMTWRVFGKPSSMVNGYGNNGAPPNAGCWTRRAATGSQGVIAVLWGGSTGSSNTAGYYLTLVDLSNTSFTNAIVAANWTSTASLFPTGLYSGSEKLSDLSHIAGEGNLALSYLNSSYIACVRFTTDFGATWGAEYQINPSATPYGSTTCGSQTGFSSFNQIYALTTTASNVTVGSIQANTLTTPQSFALGGSVPPSSIGAFAGVALTAASAGGTGKIIVSGQAEVNSTYPVSNVNIAFNNASYSPQGLQGSVAGRTYNLSGRDQ